MLAFDQLPADLRAEAQLQWQRILESQAAAPEQEVAFDGWWQAQLQRRPEIARHVLTVLVGSQFVVDWWVRKPDWLRQQIESDCFYQDQLDYAAELKQELGEAPTEAALAVTLRCYRQRQMIRIIYRDLNRLTEMLGTTGDVTALADNSIRVALGVLHPLLCEQYGTPQNRAGEPQQMVVVAMGKQGAHELNLSSDIDLIFCYPETGETAGGRKSIENQTFFLRLGQRLIKALDDTTGDGFVFRVDMRLRPYGQSGALVLNFDAMEEYYQDQGRDWERYAMVKARVVAGDEAAGQQLMALLRPFTYRRYIDFSAFDSLRSMKAMINREVQRRGKHNDVKLGAGGIREIEFIVQAFQLIRGGREVELQRRELLQILQILRDAEYLPVAAVTQLTEAYVFLRNTEHAIQAYQDRQTQALPDDAQGMQRLAWVMGFESVADFEQCLQQHRDKVRQHFHNVIAPPEEEQEEAAQQDEWLSMWVDQWDEAASSELLQQKGFEQAEESARRLISLRESNQVRGLQTIGRERLDAFIPRLLQALEDSEQPSLTLERILPLVESVVRRSAYLVLLLENPQALNQLIVLCEASPWIAERLSRHPALLDELLDVQSLYHLPNTDELRSDLQQQMLRLPWDDLEAHMEALRYFKLAHVLRVAASEVTGKLPLMKVSDYLSWIAEVILEHVLTLAWQQMVAKHGRPGKADGERCDPDFIIVAYGKLGGIELGHGSDLDLVFVHDASSSGMTDGDKQIDNGVFFTRLGQRIIHMLNTQTAQGQLYEVDMRLRPSGNSGLLVSSLQAFEDYQNKEAWTWEHQALVRARPVAGCEQLRDKFLALRADILCRERDEAKLQQEVVEMRAKMSEHLAPKSANDEKSAKFHLKHSSGGIVDIEFMVQYAVLVWAHKYPSLTRYTDNIRILETLGAEGLVVAEDVQVLTEAYKQYRALAHRQSLQRQGNEVAVERLENHPAGVKNLWQRFFSQALGKAGERE